MIHISHRIPFQPKNLELKKEIEDKETEEVVSAGEAESAEETSDAGKTGGTESSQNARGIRRPNGKFQKIDFDLLDPTDVDDASKGGKNSKNTQTHKGEGESSLTTKYNKDGSINHITLTDKDGNVVIDTDINEAMLEDMRGKMNDLHTKREEILQKLFNENDNNLIYPNPEQFMKTDENGERILDEDAYQKAIDEFEKAQEEKMQEVDALYEQLTEIDAQLDEVSNTLSIVNVMQTASQTQKTLEDLKKNGGDNSAIEKMQEELEKQKEEFANAKLNEVNSKARLNELVAEQNSLKSPVPPSPRDYTLENGSLDTEAYLKAEQAYREAMDEVQQKHAELNKKIAEENRNLTKAQMAIGRSESTVGFIEGNANILTDIQNRINATDDPDAKAELQAAYDKLSSNVEKQLEIMQKTAELSQKAMDTPIPQAPSTYDFLKDVFVGTDSNGNGVKATDAGNGEYYLLTYDENGNPMEVQIEPQFDVNGVFKVELPNGTVAFLHQEKELNTQEYADAIKKYEAEYAKYTATIKNINAQTRSLQIESMDISLDSELIQSELKFKAALSSVEDPEIRQAMQEEYEELVNTKKQINSLQKTELELFAQIDEMQNPVPPNPQDFMTTAYKGVTSDGNKCYVQVNDDGSLGITTLDPDKGWVTTQIDASALNFDANGNTMVTLENGVQVHVQARQELDTDAYMAARAEYERAGLDNERRFNELNKQIGKVETLRRMLEGKHGNISAMLDNLTRVGSELSEIQKQIVSATDPDIKADLQAQYDKIVNTTKSRINLAKQVAQLNDEMMKEPVPVPPNTYDFLTNVYQGYDSDGNNLEIKDNYDGTFSVSIFDPENGYVTVNAKPEYNGYGDVQYLILPDGSKVNVRTTKELDTDAYAKAMKEYESAKADYDRKIDDYNRKIATLQMMDAQLDMSINQAIDTAHALADCNSALADLDAKIKDAPNAMVRGQLETIRDEVKDIAKRAVEIGKQMEEVGNEYRRQPVPTAPNPRDFMVTVPQADGLSSNGNEYDVKMVNGKLHVFMQDEDGGIREFAIDDFEFDENGEANIALPNGEVIHVRATEVLDTNAYTAAMKEYEAAKAEYDKQGISYQDIMTKLMENRAALFSMLQDLYEQASQL